MSRLMLALALACALAIPCSAQVCNVKVVTDASPDFADLPSLVHSVTSKWPTDKEKVWAMYYWVHIARRQTEPIELHGIELADPIRQFNDYGFTMCSTVAGVNCALWNAMGLKVKFWDIHNHTVAECFYDDRWHMYDDSLSAIYTLCDGKTVAGVEDIGKTMGCPASGGKEEPGHIAKYHCVYSTSPNGYLQGADCERDLAQEYRCFAPPGLAYRWYFNSWDFGHRYILNLRENESYTRYYHRLDRPQPVPKGQPPKFTDARTGDEVDTRRFFIPNTKNKIDPESTNMRYGIRGNGVWTSRPSLTPVGYKNFIVSESNVAATAAGLTTAAAGKPAEVVFKVNGANVITSQHLSVGLTGNAEVAVSTNNGLTWTNVFKGTQAGDAPASIDLLDQVNGAYEVLVKVALSPAAVLKSIEIATTTEVNTKGLPKLLLGKNTVYVGAGDPSDSIVYWPDLQGDAYKAYVVEEKNVKNKPAHETWNAVMFADKGGEEAYVVFKMDAPRDITRLVYGGRFYNRGTRATTKLLHSFDGGKTWDNPYTLTEIKPPWDVIHYETVDKVPAGVRSVLFKYSWNSREAGDQSCGLYALRMEAGHKPVGPGTRALEVVYTWDEVQPDRMTVERRHAQLVKTLPFKYVINTAGADHPIVKSLTVRLAGTAPNVKYGYSDGKDVGGQKWVYRTATWGKNLLLGKPYTLSVSSQWGKDPESKKLTDGVVAANWAGGPAGNYAAGWNDLNGGAAEVVADMGAPQTVAAFRVHITAGWPWWDAMKGEVKDEISLETSLDGNTWTPQGSFEMNLWKKDVPINHMLTDDETATAWNYTLVPKAPVRARYVKYVVVPKRTMGLTEIQALDSVRFEPFDMKIALPDER